jgi:hypothetical protein
MVLLYGEGERSFVRLQEEIMKASDDHSLFAWTAKDSDPEMSQGLLATSLKEFQEAGSIALYHDWTLNSLPYEMTNKGLRITLGLCETREQNVYLATLNCLAMDRGKNALGIFLKRLSSVGDRYVRVKPNDLTLYNNHRRKANFIKTMIYVGQNMPVPEPESVHQEEQFLIQRHDYWSYSNDYVLSRIETPATSIADDDLELDQKLPIPKGSNGWIATLWFGVEEPKNLNRF